MEEPGLKELHGFLEARGRDEGRNHSRRQYGDILVVSGAHSLPSFGSDILGGHHLHPGAKQRLVGVCVAS